MTLKISNLNFSNYKWSTIATNEETRGVCALSKNNIFVPSHLSLLSIFFVNYCDQPVKKITKSLHLIWFSWYLSCMQPESKDAITLSHTETKSLSWAKLIDRRMLFAHKLHIWSLAGVWKSEMGCLKKKVFIKSFSLSETSNCALKHGSQRFCFCISTELSFFCFRALRSQEKIYLLKIITALALISLDMAWVINKYIFYYLWSFSLNVHSGCKSYLRRICM